jgi:hypothetical protein
VDQRELPFQGIALRDADGGAVARGERPRGGLDLVGPEIVGRRVDEIAAQRHRGGDPLHLGGINAGRRHDARLGSARGAIAAEAVASHQPGEGGLGGFGRILQAEGALGQQAGQLAGEQPVVGSRLGITEAEQHPGEGAIRAGQQGEAARLRLEPDGVREAALERRQGSFGLRPVRRGHQGDRHGRRVAGQQSGHRCLGIGLGHVPLMRRRDRRLNR